MSAISSWTFEKRLEETFNRALPKLGPEARAALAAVITPESLAIIATILVAWVVSHAFMSGGGIVPEGAALIATGMVSGIAFNLWSSSH